MLQNRQHLVAASVHGFVKHSFELDKSTNKTIIFFSKSTIVFSFSNCRLVFNIYLIFCLREWTDATLPTAADHTGNHDIFAGYLSLFLFNSFLCQSCHLDRASNVEIGVEYRMIFVVMVFFHVGAKHIWGYLQGTLMQFYDSRNPVL